MRRILVYLISFVIILAALFAGIGIYLRTRLPNIDGNFYCDKIQEEVKVIRDEWGVPHIDAENGRDAYFVYGFTVAQDRLFQMELQRRAAKGELAEVIGPSLLEFDKLIRTLMLKHVMEDYLKKEDKINPRALELFDSFIAGINYFIETQALPVEFDLLGFKPKKFTRLDCLSFWGLMAYNFATAIETDSLLSILKAKLPAQKLKKLFPEYSNENKVTIMEPSKQSRIDAPSRNFRRKASGSDKNQNLIKVIRKIQECLDLFPGSLGSNSWVIGPSRSQSGMPILANDPHVDIGNPGTYYEAQINENYGFHLPLIPFSPVSFSKYKAVANTMLGQDDLDLYYETFSSDVPNQVMYKGKWVKVKTIEETIKVKGQDDIKLMIRITPHGPIITDFIKGYTGKPVSIFWVFHKVECPFLDVAYELATAQDLKGFEKSISKWVAPGMNFSCVDNKGNIAWWAAGRFPVRPEHVNSREILDGSSGKDEILGYLPFSKNPHLINPKSGIIVTANNKPTNKAVGPIKNLQGYWSPSDRAARINELLSTKPKWDIEELKKVQTDLKSYAAPQMVSALSKIIGSASKAGKHFNKTEKQAYYKLKSWDFNNDISSIGSSIYHFTIYHLLREALVDDLGNEYFTAYLNLGSKDQFNFLKSLIKDEKSDFWDNIKTSKQETRKEIVMKAFKKAVLELKNKLGANVDAWQWGRLHTIEFVHPVGQKKPLNLLFNIGPFAAPGADFAINKLSSKMGKNDYKVFRAPSTRLLVDFGDLSQTYSILPTGNSGNFLSPYFDDQVGMWLKGEYRVNNFSPEQIERNKKHEMLFVPN